MLSESARSLSEPFLSLLLCAVSLVPNARPRESDVLISFSTNCISIVVHREKRTRPRRD